MLSQQQEKYGKGSFVRDTMLAHNSQCRSDTFFYSNPPNDFLTHQLGQHILVQSRA
jgi:hypothetical protein